MGKKKVLPLLLFTTLISLSADNITLVTLDWQPFYGRDLHKYGYCVEIARQALARNGHTMTIDFMPWARAQQEVLSGNYHGLFGTWKNNEADDLYLLSEAVLGSGDGHFLDLLNSHYHELGPEDLDGMVVGYVRGYPVSEELYSLFESGTVIKQEVDSIVQLFYMLQLGRIDIILENYQVARYHFSNQWPHQTFDLKIVGQDVIDGGLHIGWSKIISDSEQLRDDFDEAIREMQSDGTIDAIMLEFDGEQ